MAYDCTDTAAFKGVWVFCEQREGKLMPTDFELISEARKLADELGCELSGLLLGRYAPAHLLIVAGASLGCAVGTVAYPILTQAAFGTRAYTAIYGFISAANSLACSLAPIFSNAVYDATGSYNGALLTCVGLTILALCLLAFVRPLAPGAQIADR